MNMQPFLRRQQGFRDVPCPVAERLWERGMYIPCGIDLPDETLAEIVGARSAPPPAVPHVINSFTGLHAELLRRDLRRQAVRGRGALRRRRARGGAGRRPRTLLDLACGTGRHAARVRGGWGSRSRAWNQRRAARPRARERAARTSSSCEQDMTRARPRRGALRRGHLPVRLDRLPAARRARRSRRSPALRRHLARRRSARGRVPARARDAALHADPLRVRRWETPDGGELLRVSETGLDVAPVR